MKIGKSVFWALALGVVWILGNMEKKKSRKRPTPEPEPPYNGVTIPVGKRDRRARPCT